MSNKDTLSKSDFTPRLLAMGTSRATIHAPLQSIDITDWILHIDELEYINCTPNSKAHLAAGFTHAPDGRRMVINVEDFGGALILHHFVEEIGEKLHCRLVSTSDILMGREYTTGHVIWDATATPIDDDHCEFVATGWVYTTEKYEQFITAHGITFEQAKEQLQASLDAHKEEETPCFAASIQRKALGSKG